MPCHSVSCLAVHIMNMNNQVRARLSQGDQRVEAEPGHSANVGVHVTNAVGFNMIRHWNFYLSFHLTSCTKCEVTRSKTAAG